MRFLVLAVALALAAGSARAGGHASFRGRSGGGRAAGGGGARVMGGARTSGTASVARPRAAAPARVFVSRPAPARAVAARTTARRAGETAPAAWSKPGALVRTEGQLPVYSDPGNARIHGVDGGGFIGQAAAGPSAATISGGGVGANVAQASVPREFDPSF